jgi:hypothetical protein
VTAALSATGPEALPNTLSADRLAGTGAPGPLLAGLAVTALILWAVRFRLARPTTRSPR